MWRTPWMRFDLVTVIGGLSAALALAVALGLAPRALGAELRSELYEVYYELEARLTSAALDATVDAATTLEMEATAAESGVLRLSLRRLLGPSWKYYRVDPAGPLGRESKLAALVALPSPSWEEVERAEREVERLGAERHHLAGATPQPFDDAFAFFVVGPERGRFTLELGPEGRLLSTHDGLTDQWLSGDLDPLLKAWEASARGSGESPRGYWFWNRGEGEPPSWEPHTVHALVTALDLLALPTGPTTRENKGGGPPGAFTQELAAVGEAVVAVLTRLAPKVRGRLQAAGAITAQGKAATTPSGLVERTLVAQGAPLEARDPARLDFSRQQCWVASSGRVIADEIIATVSSADSRIVLKVGVRPRSTTLASGFFQCQTTPPV